MPADVRTLAEGRGEGAPVPVAAHSRRPADAADAPALAESMADTPPAAPAPSSIRTPWPASSWTVPSTIPARKDSEQLILADCASGDERQRWSLPET